MENQHWDNTLPLTAQKRKLSLTFSRRETAFPSVGRNGVEYSAPLLVTKRTLVTKCQENYILQLSR